MSKFRVAILGSGNIGTDLMVKTMRSPTLECAVLIGRNLSSPGLSKAQAMGVPISTDSIACIEKNPKNFDIVFDATSAASHKEHAVILAKLGLPVIDLTPAKLGKFCVPVINLEECLGMANLNMVTCGGQASVPIAYALGQTHSDIEYIEVVSSISSRSAGPATRRNLDEYIHTTESAIRDFSGCRISKAILNLNPAIPCINMQTTVMAKIAKPNIDAFTAKLEQITKQIQSYIPGYEILVKPKIDGDRIITMIKVTGRGDYLPSYAGNLDIINCSAIALAEGFAGQKVKDCSAHLRVVS